MSPSGNPRFVAIDSLRGLAAVYVLLYHLPWQTHLSHTQFAANGFIAVDLFFIISGFVIASAYAGRIVDSGSFGRFMVARFFRIYPLHVATLLALVALELARLGLVSLKGSVAGPVPFTGERSLELLAAHFLLIQGLGILSSVGWNAPSWSISVEFVAYAVFGAAALAGARMRRVFHPIVGFAVVAVLYVALVQVWGAVYGSALLRCLAGFLLGVALLSVTRRTEFTKKVASWPAAARETVEVAVFAGIVIIVSTAPSVTVLAVIPFFAAAVLLASAERGAVSRLLRRTPFMFLGRVSYSIYMVHVLCMTLLAIVAKRVAGAEAYVQVNDRLLMSIDLYAGDALLILALVLVLVLASFTFAWIEEPGRRFGRSLGAARAVVAVPSPA